MASDEESWTDQRTTTADHHPSPNSGAQQSPRGHVSHTGTRSPTCCWTCWPRWSLPPSWQGILWWRCSWWWFCLRPCGVLWVWRDLLAWGWLWRHRVLPQRPWRAGGLGSWRWVWSRSWLLWWWTSSWPFCRSSSLWWGLRGLPGRPKEVQWPQAGKGFPSSCRFGWCSSEPHTWAVTYLLYFVSWPWKGQRP